MNHHDAEVTDVVVVFDGRDGKPMADAVKSLKDLGLAVSSVNNDECVVEGSIDSEKVPQLKAVPGVCYVRSVFTYVADYPTGDPRDKDCPDEDCETEDE